MSGTVSRSQTTMLALIADACLGDPINHYGTTSPRNAACSHILQLLAQMMKVRLGQILVAANPRRAMLPP